MSARLQSHAASCTGLASTSSSRRRPQRKATVMKLALERWDTEKKGKFESKKLLQQLRDEGYSCSTYTFPPGCVFGDHSHGQDKKDAILAGEFLFRMDGEEVILKAGDTLEVPRGHVHYAEVVGKNSCVFVDASR